MSKEREQPIFTTLGADVKEARSAIGMSQKALAEKLHIAPRYLANIENSGSIPSMSVFYDLVEILKLPVLKYFYPEQVEPESEQRRRVTMKLRLCPEKYLPVTEGTIDGLIKLDETEKLNKC